MICKIQSINIEIISIHPFIMHIKCKPWHKWQRLVPIWPRRALQVKTNHSRKIKNRFKYVFFFTCSFTMFWTPLYMAVNAEGNFLSSDSGKKKKKMCWPWTKQRSRAPCRVYGNRSSALPPPSLCQQQTKPAKFALLLSKSSPCVFAGCFLFSPHNRSQQLLLGITLQSPRRALCDGAALSLCCRCLQAAWVAMTRLVEATQAAGIGTGVHLECARCHFGNGVGRSADLLGRSPGRAYDQNSKPSPYPSSDRQSANYNPIHVCPNYKNNPYKTWSFIGTPLSCVNKIS